jgi:CHASE2 domain-containing sensor protein
MGPQAAAEPFGLVNLEEDVDGYVRRARPAFLDESPIPRDAFAARIARLAARPGPAVRSRSTAPLLIDGRIRWQDAPVVSWKDLTSFLGQGASALTGQIAVIGGNFEGSGDDYLRLPSASGKRVSGVFIQGLVAESFAASDPLSELSATTRSVLLAGAALMAFAVTLLFSSRVALIVLSVAAVLYTAIAFAFISTLGMVLPWPSVLLAVVAGATMAAVIRGLTRKPPSLPGSQADRFQTSGGPGSGGAGGGRGTGRFFKA